MHNYRANDSFLSGCSLSQVGLWSWLLRRVSVHERAHAGMQCKEWDLHLQAWLSWQKVSERYNRKPDLLFLFLCHSIISHLLCSAAAATDTHILLIILSVVFHASNAISAGYHSAYRDIKGNTA